MSSITYQLRFVDLKSATSRDQIRQSIGISKQIWFQQPDDTLLNQDDLLRALNAFSDENEASELNLDELETLTGGVGLPEALVSSCIMMCMISGASGMFANSMETMGDSQIRDALNSGLNANIESVRHELSQYALDEHGIYSPDENVNHDNLGAKFLAHPETDLGTDRNQAAGLQTIEKIGGMDVNRTITAAKDGITVTYTYDGVEIQSTSMVAPASGWLS